MARRLSMNLLAACGGALVALGIGACGNQAKSGTQAPEAAMSTPPRPWVAREGTSTPAEPARAPVSQSDCSGYVPNVGPNFSVAPLAFPTGDVRSSGLLVHHVMPREVRVNQPYEYQIHVTNVTGITLQNVVISAGGFQNQVITAAAPGATAGQGGAATWTYPTLASCKTEVIRVTAKADKAGMASSACVSASYANALCNSTNVVEPTLAIGKTITPQALICDPVQMVIEVKNTGSGAATNVKVTDQLPAGLTTADGKTALEFDAGTLAAGQARQFPVALKATKTGKFENAAKATADGGLTAQSQTVATVITQPKLELACKASDQVFVGRDGTFELTVKNTGSAACTTVITMPMPAGAAFLSGSEGVTAAGGTASFNAGSLAPNQSKTFTLNFRGDAIGNLAFQAQASCPCADTVRTACSSNVVGIPALLLNGTDDPDPIRVGQTVTYTLVVTNQGSANLTNVMLLCDMEETHMAYVSQTGPTQGQVQGDKINFAPIATLAPKEVRTYTVTVRATKAGQVQFKAESKSDQITRALVKIETTNFYE